jgi:hypothetical protein
MKTIPEFRGRLVSITRVKIVEDAQDDEADDIFNNPSLDFGETGNSPQDDASYGDPESSTNPDDDSDLDLDDTTISDESDPDENEDPDRQGLIRTVKDAHLVYKRKSADDTYEELWIYNVPDMKTELEIRKAILSGTDIPVNQSQSDDGSQEYHIWSIGNAELLHVTGLTN